MSKKGFGNYQSQEKRANRNKILEVLKDGQQHQYSEILNKTKLSRRIVSKHLKELKRKQLIDREESKDDLRLKYYKTTPTFTELYFQANIIDSSWLDIKNEFTQTRDLSLAITRINYFANFCMIKILLHIQNKEIDFNSPDTLETFLEFFLWNLYQTLTLNLVTLCIDSKILNEINLVEITKKLMEK